MKKNNFRQIIKSTISIFITISMLSSYIPAYAQTPANQPESLFDISENTNTNTFDTDTDPISSVNSSISVNSAQNTESLEDIDTISNTIPDTDFNDEISSNDKSGQSAETLATQTPEIELFDTKLTSHCGKYTIVAEGPMPNGVDLSVKQIYNYDELEEKIEDEAGFPNYDINIAFDIELLVDGVTWQPSSANSEINISVKNLDPDLTQSEFFKVCRIYDKEDIDQIKEETGKDNVSEVTSLPVDIIDENNVEITTDHFTVYTFGEVTVNVDGTAAYLLEGALGEFEDPNAPCFFDTVNEVIESTGISSEDITEVTFTDEPWEDIESSANVSIEGLPVYVHIKDTTLEFYTEADKVYLNEDPACMFEGFTKVTNLEFLEDSRIDTSLAKNMSSMFYGCSSLESFDISHWDFSNVTYAYQMFYGCTSLTSIRGISDLNTSKLESTERMFYNTKLTGDLDLSGWDVSKVVEFTEMFYGCNKLEHLNISSWRTLTIKKDGIEYMFHGCSSLKNIEMFTIESPSFSISMLGIFYDCSALVSADLSNLNNVKITDFALAFAGCRNLNNIIGLETLDFSLCNDFSCAFSQTKKLKSLSLPQRLQGDLGNFLQSSGIETLDIIATPTDASDMFWNCHSLTSINNLSAWDMSNCVSTRGLFCWCESLSVSGISNWNMSSVTDMSSMFNHCYIDSDLSGWNISNCTDMSSIFLGCYSDVDISDWHINNSANLDSAFKDSSFAELDFTNWTCFLNRTDLTKNDNFEYTFYSENIQKIKNLTVSVNYEKSNVLLSGEYYLDDNDDGVPDFPTPVVSVITDGTPHTYIKKHRVEFATEMTDPQEQTRYSHSYNISDSGVKQGNYPEKTSTKDTVTIPGAESLHIVLTYGTEDDWDWVAICKGEYTKKQLYRAKWSNNDSFDFKQFKQKSVAHYTGSPDSPQTVELDIPGDTVTFVFYSDDNTNGYGYYATVTGVSSLQIQSSLTRYVDNQSKITKPDLEENIEWKKYKAKDLFDFDTSKITENTILVPNTFITQATILPGKQFNQAIKCLVNSSATYSTQLNARYYAIKEITWVDEPWENVENSINVAETGEIYARKVNDEKYSNTYRIELYSPCEKIYLNQNSSYMFYNFASGINNFCSKIDSSKLENADHMFDFNLNSSYGSVNSADFYSVKNCRNIDLSNWDLSQLSTCVSMFSYCGEINLSNLDIPAIISNAQTKGYSTPLYNITAENKNNKIIGLTIPADYNTEYGQIEIKAYLDDNNDDFIDQLQEYDHPHNYELDKYTLIDGQPHNYISPSACITVDIIDPEFNNINLKNDKIYPVDDHEYFETIYAPYFGSHLEKDHYIAKPADPSTPDNGAAFYGWIDQNAYKKYNFDQPLPSDNLRPKLIALFNENSATMAGTTFSSVFDSDTHNSITDIIWVDEPWENLDNSIIVSEEGIVFARANGTNIELYTEATKVYLNENCTSMFSNFNKLSGCPSFLNTVDISKVKTINYMFRDCKSITTIDLSNFDMHNIEGMSGMFHGCENLKTVNTQDIDFSSVTNTDYMFCNCYKLENVGNPSEWGLTNLVTSQNMFYNCKALESIDISGLRYKNNKIYADFMFYKCIALKNVNVSDWIAGQASNVNFMFGDCVSLKTLDLSTWTIPIGEKPNFHNLITNCRNLYDFTMPDTTPSQEEQYPPYTDFINTPHMFLDNNRDFIPDDYSELTQTIPSAAAGVCNHYIGTHKVTFLQDPEVITPEPPAYSVHTENIDDFGVATESYESDMDKTYIYKEEGAEELHLTIIYCIEEDYDSVTVYQGETDENYIECFSEGGSIHASELIIPGDTASFHFQSDSSCEYYGFYVVKTEDVNKVTPTYEDYEYDNAIQPIPYENGEKFVLADGQHSASPLSPAPTKGEKMLSYWHPIDSETRYDFSQPVLQDIALLPAFAIPTASVKFADSELTTHQTTTVSTPAASHAPTGLTAQSVTLDGADILHINLKYSHEDSNSLKIYKEKFEDGDNLNEFIQNHTPVYTCTQSVYNEPVDILGDTLTFVFNDEYVSSYSGKTSAYYCADITSDSYADAEYTDLRQMYVEIPDYITLPVAPTKDGKSFVGFRELGTQNIWKAGSTAHVMSDDPTIFIAEWATLPLTMGGEAFNSALSKCINDASLIYPDAMQDSFPSLELVGSSTVVDIMNDIDTLGLQAYPITDEAGRYVATLSYDPTLNRVTAMPAIANTPIKLSDATKMFSNTRLSSIEDFLFPADGYVGLDTSGMTSMYYAFQNCTITSPSGIDISGWDTSNVTTMYCTFSYTDTPLLNLGDFSTESSTNFNYMFYYFNYRHDEPMFIDMSTFDFSNAESAYEPFCYAAISPESFASFNGKVHGSVNHLFYGIKTLQSIESLEGFDLSEANTPGINDNILANCENIVNADFSKIKFPQGTGFCNILCWGMYSLKNVSFAGMEIGYNPENKFGYSDTKLDTVDLRDSTLKSNRIQVTYYKTPTGASWPTKVNTAVDDPSELSISYITSDEVRAIIAEGDSRQTEFNGVTYTGAYIIINDALYRVELTDSKYCLYPYNPVNKPTEDVYYPAVIDYGLSSWNDFFNLSLIEQEYKSPIYQFHFAKTIYMPDGIEYLPGRFLYNMNAETIYGLEDVNSIAPNALEYGGSAIKVLQLPDHSSFRSGCWLNYDWDNSNRSAGLWEASVPATIGLIGDASTTAIGLTEPAPITVKSYIAPKNISVDIANEDGILRMNDAQSGNTMDVSVSITSSGDEIICPDNAEPYLADKHEATFALQEIPDPGVYTGNITLEFTASSPLVVFGLGLINNSEQTQYESKYQKIYVRGSENTASLLGNTTYNTLDGGTATVTPIQITDNLLTKQQIDIHSPIEAIPDSKYEITREFIPDSTAYMSLSITDMNETPDGYTTVWFHMHEEYDSQTLLPCYFGKTFDGVIPTDENYIHTYSDICSYNILTNDIIQAFTDAGIGRISVINGEDTLVPVTEEDFCYLTGDADETVHRETLDLPRLGYMDSDRNISTDLYYTNWGGPKLEEAFSEALNQAYESLTLNLFNAITIKQPYIYIAPDDPAEDCWYYMDLEDSIDFCDQFGGIKYNADGIPYLSDGTNEFPVVELPENIFAGVNIEGYEILTNMGTITYYLYFEEDGLKEYFENVPTDEDGNTLPVIVLVSNTVNNIPTVNFLHTIMPLQLEGTGALR